MLVYFTSSIKRDLKFCVLFRIFLLVTTLKISFSSSLVIIFYLDAIYYIKNVLVFLINKSNLSITKQIFDRATIFAYSRYFLGCLQLCLTEARKTKIAKSNLAVDSIKIIFIESIFIWDIFTKVVFTEGIYISIRLSGIGSWLSIK